MQRNVSRPLCLTCEFLIHNREFYSQYFSYRNAITKRESKISVKARGMFCRHPEYCDERGKPKKINLNHVRWWGFPPECPNNPYKHTCNYCGKRMTTASYICSSCKKARQYY